MVMTLERDVDERLGQGLAAYFNRRDESRTGADVAQAVLSLAGAAADISAMIDAGPFTGALGAETGGANEDGDRQKRLDVLANERVLEAVRATRAAYYASEEEDAILTLDPQGSLAIAVDPLDGSSNIDANISIGTIFSIFPVSAEGATDSFFRPGEEQVAAGYFIYGPHTALALTLGEGVDIFVLDRATGVFRLARAGVRIAAQTHEFAINVSNYRHWFEPIRQFIDDCILGAEGPRGKDFNMRWVASLVAETHRIFSRGGVFLYPADHRPGYERGRLRLIYEAFPIALLAEQAGGAAMDGHERILDRTPTALHQRTPLIFGATEKVEVIAGYHNDPAAQIEHSPLFGRRGLFRS